MWIDSQKWRRDFKVDELYETFDYKEKEAVDKLYPRYDLSFLAPSCVADKYRLDSTTRLTKYAEASIPADPR